MLHVQRKKGRRRGEGRKEEGEGSKEKGRDGKSISLYILPPPDRPPLRQVLVTIIIITVEIN